MLDAIDFSVMEANTMVKLFISADLEGAVNVCSPLQCTPHKDRPAYDHAVATLAKELNVVVETALANGVDHIVVNDSHMAMTNLNLDHVGSRVSLLSGKPKNCAMSAGLDATFDAAMYIGYHAKAGSHLGTLNHTFHDKLFDVSINGVSYGEGGINALYASLVHQVPVILASGDATFCTEITQLIPALQTVTTKTALSTTAVLSRPMDAVLKDYQAQTQAVLSQANTWKNNLLTLQAPYTLQITFITSLAADVAMTMPTLSRIDGRTVQYQSDDFQAIYQTLQSAYALLGYTAYME